jgi:hypothetical protein
VREFEDAESIQLALRQVINWIAQGMNPKRAALTLYALQIASANLKSMSRIIHAGDVVRELPEETEAREARAAARSERSSRVSHAPETRNSKPETASKKPAASVRPRKQRQATPPVKSAQIRGQQLAVTEQPVTAREHLETRNLKLETALKKPNGHIRVTRNEEPETKPPWRAASS